jgi:6-phosphogluconolactonase
MRVSAMTGVGCTLVLSLGLGACGGSGGASFSQNPPPPQATEYLYGSDLANVVVTEKIDSSSGALGTGTTTPGSNGVSIAANPLGTFLFAPDPAVNGVDVFATSSTGAISAISGSPFLIPGSGGVNGVAVDSSGKYLYATSKNGSGILAGFSIGASGALTVVPGSPFTAGSTPNQIAVDPAAGFLYVSDTSNGILGYSISPSNGALTPIPPVSIAGGFQGIAITPNGKFLYAVDISNLVFAYSIATDGSLTSVSGSPFSNVAGSGLYSWRVLVEPKGRFLYTYNTVGAPNTISAFTIDGTTGGFRRFRDRHTARRSRPILRPAWWPIRWGNSCTLRVRVEHVACSGLILTQRRGR